MFADGLRIVQGRTDRPGMQGVIVVLVDGLVGIELEKGILGPIIPVAVVDVDGSGQVQGQGPVGFFELMAEGKIRAIDIKARVHAGRGPNGVADGGIVLIDGIGEGGRIRGGRLKSDVRTEHEGIIAVNFVLHVEIDALVGRPGNGRRGIGNDIGAVGGAGDEFVGQTILIEGDMGKIIEIAAIIYIFILLYIIIYKFY